jgi:hypothetical protein
VPGRISEDAFAFELGRTQCEDTWRGLGHVLNHDVQVRLLRYSRIRPGGTSVIGCPLEGQT